MPSYCPLGADGSPCRIIKHSFRERKTGPAQALVVAVCTCHKMHFTLYPSGHVPYGRHAVAPVDAWGRACGDWRRTLFLAAIMAASGEPAWSRDFDGGPGWWTQRRQIKSAARWFGLLCPTRQAESIAETLGVGILVHSGAAGKYILAKGFRQRACAVIQVLDAMACDGLLLARVLRAGYQAGACPEPWIWTGKSYLAPFPNAIRQIAT